MKRGQADREFNSGLISTHFTSKRREWLNASKSVEPI